MQLANLRTKAGIQLGVCLDEQMVNVSSALMDRARWSARLDRFGVAPSAFASSTAVLHSGAAALRIAEEVAWEVVDRPGGCEDAIQPLGETNFAASVSASSKILCAALNYYSHAEEAGIAPPDAPLLFAKLPNAIVDPGGQVYHYSFSEMMDYEVELGVVIGRSGRGIPSYEAMDHVAGFTVVNDISYRDLQMRKSQGSGLTIDWIRGKSLDGSVPMGPVIVTKDELSVEDLRMEQRVNGRLRQSGSTDDMIHDINQLIAHASLGMTLEVGDVIATGTCAGVAAFSGEFLQPGDRIEAYIEGIGTLSNYVVTVGEAT